MASRRTILFGIGAAGLALSACAGPRGRGGPRGGGLMAVSPNSFARGIELKQQDQFRDALPFFAQVAGLGSGYEVAQYHLGDCILLMGDDEVDQLAASQKHREGAFWVSLAAQSGDVNAQALYAKLLFAGKGVVPDRVEAAKFANLADGNSRAEFMHGERRTELDIVRAGLTPDEVDEGRHRAASFERLDQTHRSLPEIERQSRPSRPSGGRGSGGGRGGGGPGGGR